MCEYVSFCVDRKTGDVLVGDLWSHSETEQLLGLAPDSYREAEWTKDDDGASLSVRCLEDDPLSAGEYRACVLASYPTRRALLESITICSGPGGTMHYQNGQLHRDDGPAAEWADGSKEWCQNGQLHRDDGPAVEWADGTKSWYQNGRLHRGDGPAIERPDGTKEWYQNGQLHRDDGPAIECADGTKRWHKNGQLHRDDGPAVEWADGTKEWHKNGLLHRDDGPAIERADGTKKWYKNGLHIKIGAAT